MFKDLTGRAIYDYYTQRSPAKLWIYNRYGPKEEMPVSIYFRSVQEMPALELTALQHCEGKILDIGAGAGSHSLILQQRGYDVTALDISPLSVQVAQCRGVKQTVVADIFEYYTARYQTLLLLMNGIGLVGTIEELNNFLTHVKSLLLPGGQILLDSSDVAYLYQGKAKPLQKYYGEIEYQYRYKSQKTDWFSWLYIDCHTLTQTAAAHGWNTEMLYDDGYDQYLAKLTLV